jgi:hypothetical protein
MPFAIAKIQKASFDLSTRYDSINHGKDQERMQERLRVNMEGDVSKYWSIKTMLATGNDYTTPWSTYYNFNSYGEIEQNFNVRQLYGEFNDNHNYKFQVGVIPPYKDYLRTNLVSSGWVEGASYTLKQDRFTTKATTGSLSDVNEVRMYARQRAWNYGKIKSEYHFDHNMIAGLAAAQLDKDQYLQWNVRGNPFDEYKDKFNFIIESLFNTKVGVRNYSFGVNSYPLAFKKPELKDYFYFQIAYIYLDEKIGTLGTLLEDFYAYKTTLFVEGAGKITKDNRWSWILEYRQNDIPRLNAGIMYKYEFK